MIRNIILEWKLGNSLEEGLEKGWESRGEIPTKIVEVTDSPDDSI